MCSDVTLPMSSGHIMIKKELGNDLAGAA